MAEIDAVVAEINAGGGVRLKGGPKKLRLEVKDNASSPATALANAREAVSEHAAVLLIDGTGAATVADVTDAAKLPAFVLFDGGADLIEPARHPSMFRLAPADAIMTRRLSCHHGERTCSGRAIRPAPGASSTELRQAESAR